MTHTQGSQDGDFIDLQVFIVVWELPISGNTTKGLHMQVADKTTMIPIQQMKNYVFHLLVGKFTNIPQIHVLFHG
jgi:hypothetical protein